MYHLSMEIGYVYIIKIDDCDVPDFLLMMSQLLKGHATISHDDSHSFRLVLLMAGLRYSSSAHVKNKKNICRKPG